LHAFDSPRKARRHGEKQAGAEQSISVDPPCAAVTVSPARDYSSPRASAGGIARKHRTLFRKQEELMQAH
jgi:hypothetical protein